MINLIDNFILKSHKQSNKSKVFLIVKTTTKDKSSILIASEANNP